MRASLLYLMTVFCAARVLACAPTTGPTDDPSELTSFQSKGEEETPEAEDPFEALRTRAAEEHGAEPVAKDRPVLVWTLDGAAKPIVVTKSSELTIQAPDLLRGQTSFQIQSRSTPVVALLMTTRQGLATGASPYTCAETGGQLAVLSGEGADVWRTKGYPDNDCSLTIDTKQAEDVIAGVPARTRYEGHFEGRVFAPDGTAHHVRAAFIVFGS